MPDNLKNLAAMMVMQGVDKLYAKILSNNDNSKNQVYLGGGFSALNLLPHHEIETDNSNFAGSVRDRAKAGIDFFWLGKNGIHKAPKAQLILYPKFPEVRMSGLLMGCTEAPSALMRQRLEGRILFFGVAEYEKIIGYVSAPDVALTKEFLSLEFSKTGVFSDLTSLLAAGDNSKQNLLNRLEEINRLGWVPSQKLSALGVSEPYSAPNGGGYTLEALLGIKPNAFAAPDYLGWEVKQYSVSNLEKNNAKTPVTVFTPEPTEGVYTASGVEEFIRRYGYPDLNGKEGRLNFGGVYKNGAEYNHRTHLTLNIEGYDSNKQKITDMNGRVELIHRNGELAAAWPFLKLISHWKTKHSKAAYVPSIKKASPIEYRYGSCISLYQGTDFLLFLKSLSAGDIYIDPALKLETDKFGGTKVKRRNQFRISHKSLPKLYEDCEVIKI